MLKYVQGGPQGQEEEDEPSTSSSTNLDQPSTSSSSPGHQPSTRGAFPKQPTNLALNQHGTMHR